MKYSIETASQYNSRVPRGSQFTSLTGGLKQSRSRIRKSGFVVCLNSGAAFFFVYKSIAHEFIVQLDTRKIDVSKFKPVWTAAKIQYLKRKIVHN